MEKHRYRVEVPVKDNRSFCLEMQNQAGRLDDQLESAHNRGHLAKTLFLPLSA